MTTPRALLQGRAFRFDSHHGRGLEQLAALGLGALVSASLLAGCGVDAREFDTPPISAFGGAGAAGVSGVGQGGGSDGSGLGSAGSAATPVVQVLNTGVACISDDRCESGNCEATANDAASVCCAAACGADARCRADGLRCEAVARQRGES